MRRFKRPAGGPKRIYNGSQRWDSVGNIRYLGAAFVMQIMVFTRPGLAYWLATCSGWMWGCERACHRTPAEANRRAAPTVFYSPWRPRVAYRDEAIII